ncbi:hypothetical protein GCM10023205_57630 [Yinghuangia aomiensis]|uniref:Uncharacterized protein n=1 Tax=Yinghuangia aomiensis TaxID=676205 RepID=A0ABP9HXQ9_9ACTN
MDPTARHGGPEPAYDVGAALDMLWLTGSTPDAAMAWLGGALGTGPDPAAEPEGGGGAGYGAPAGFDWGPGGGKPPPAPTPGFPAAPVQLPSWDDGGTPVRALPMRIRAEPRLPAARALENALKPLGSTADAPGRTDLDIDRTAEAMAVADAFVPVLRPQREPRWDLLLVRDTSAATAPWGAVLRELADVLRRSGVFRTVREIHADVSGPEPRFTASDRTTPCDPARMLADGGRGMVFVITDGVCEGWQSAAAIGHLGSWHERGPVVVWHLLPERLWAKTAIAPSRVVLRPSLGARHRPRILVCRDDDRPPVPVDDADFLALPVLAFDGAPVLHWAPGRETAEPPWSHVRRLMGMLVGRTQGIRELTAAAWVVPRSAPRAAPHPPGPVPVDLPAEQRVDTFLRTVPPSCADLLYGLAGTAPITFETMRLVNAVVNERPDPADVAEVFLSGLLVRTDDEAAEAPPEEAPYDFPADVRAVLLSRCTSAELLAMYDRIAQEVARRLGSDAVAFRVLLSGEDFPAPARIADGARPLAYLTAALLRRLANNPEVRNAALLERLAAGGPDLAPGTPIPGFRKPEPAPPPGSAPPPSRPPSGTPQLSAADPGTPGPAAEAARPRGVLGGALLDGARMVVPAADVADAIGTLPPEPAPEPEPGRDRRRPSAVPRVALLGGQASGKTTFLVVAALRMFTTDRGARLDLDLPGVALDDVLITPRDDATKEFVHRAGVSIIEQRVFPNATSQPEDLRLRVDARCTVRRRLRWRRKLSWRVAFDLELHDRAGGDFEEPDSPLTLGADAVRNVRDTHGIVFLADLSSPAAAAHTAASLSRFIPRLRPDGLPEEAADRLPHFVAVCVSKCDDARVRDRVLGGASAPGAAGVEAALRRLAARGDADVDTMLRVLGTWFHHDRVRYFGTTSVGWDYQGDAFRLRGRPVQPVNVWEPMVWLASSVGAFAGETS